MASLLPGEGDHIILCARRDLYATALPQLQVGDQVTFRAYYGEYVYQVRETKVFSPEDTDLLQQTGKETLTIYTGYPVDARGAAPQRYAVICDKRSGSSVTWQE